MSLTDEQLAEMRERVAFARNDEDCWIGAGSGEVAALLAEIDRLRSELAAYKRVINEIPVDHLFERHEDAPVGGCMRCQLDEAIRERDKLRAQRDALLAKALVSTVDADVVRRVYGESTSEASS